MSKDNRSHVFSGSSAEGLKVAEALQVALDYTCETQVWCQGVFGLGGGVLEDLEVATSRADFAILVLTPDDTVTSRDATSPSPRDNVIFELGLFIGALGLNQAHLSLPADEPARVRRVHTPPSAGSQESRKGRVVRQSSVVWLRVNGSAACRGTMRPAGSVYPEPSAARKMRARFGRQASAR
jgi:hypothetical protein